MVVVHPVRVVNQPGLRHQVRGGRRAGNRRAQHAFKLFPGVLFQGSYRVSIELPFLLFSVGIEEAGVVYAVAHDGPISFDHGLGYFGEVLQNCHVEGHAALDVVLVQRLQHAPEPHPVAEVTVGILQHVGVWGPGPGVPNAGVVGRVLVMLHVRGNPKCNPGAIGPFDDGTIDNRAVVHPVGLQRHWLTLPIQAAVIGALTSFRRLGRCAAGEAVRLTVERLNRRPTAAGGPGWEKRFRSQRPPGTGSLRRTDGQ